MRTADPLHSEVEIKWRADDVSLPRFVSFCTQCSPTRFYHAVGPDYYLRQGDNVVRYRHEGGGGTLTVKQRKSENSIRDRIEVDLPQNGSLDEVLAFLKAAGFRQEATVVKSAYIYWFTYCGVDLNVCLYDVEITTRPDDKMGRYLGRFIELEVEKHHNHHPDAAEVVDRWAELLTGRFELEAPLNDSLYELATGNRYRMAP